MLRRLRSAWRSKRSTLLLDLDAFEYNLVRMADEVGRTRLALRPHAKAHKCAEIAHRQMALGAVGVCCQKVSEAEAFVEAGVANVFVSNEIVAPPKLDRLASLARRATIGVCVDDLSVAPALSAAATRNGVVLDVMVEIDVGGARCGQLPGDAAVRLAESVAAPRHLRPRGLQAYQGRAQHLRAYDERRAAIERAAAGARLTVEMLQARGLACDVVGGAGTGTYAFEAASGVYTEVQPGSNIFMDGHYAQDLDESGRPVSTYRHSLFVYTQVMSAPGRGFAVVDAGLKAIAFDSGMPWVAGRPEVPYSRPSDEHGLLDMRAVVGGFELGTKHNLIPGHCDPTVNLYDWYVCIRAGRVECLWPVVARGAIA